MKSIKEEAQGFIPKQTKMKNISELPQVSVDLEIKEGKGIDEHDKEFSFKFVEINGERYRMPNIVLGLIKDILEENPNMQTFKVKKTGEGLKTRYTLIPLS